MRSAWPCTRRRLPGRRVAATPVRSYFKNRSSAPFHPYRSEKRRFIFCGPVPFARISPMKVAVSDRLALWCPDFPRQRFRLAGATIRRPQPLYNARRYITKNAASTRILAAQNELRKYTFKRCALSVRRGFRRAAFPDSTVRRKRLLFSTVSSGRSKYSSAARPKNKSPPR